MCHVTQRRLTQRAAVSYPMWWVTYDSTRLCSRCYTCVKFPNQFLHLPMAVRRVRRDRSNGWKSFLQMFARTTRHSGTSRAKGEHACVMKTGESHWQNKLGLCWHAFILLQGHIGLPGEPGDPGRQGNWVNNCTIYQNHAVMKPYNTLYLCVYLAFPRY